MFSWKGGGGGIVCDPRGILEKQPRPYTAQLLNIIIIIILINLNIIKLQ
jgi:hypothetical protein